MPRQPHTVGFPTIAPRHMLPEQHWAELEQAVPRLMQLSQMLLTQCSATLPWYEQQSEESQLPVQESPRPPQLTGTVHEPPMHDGALEQHWESETQFWPPLLPATVMGQDLVAELPPLAEMLDVDVSREVGVPLTRPPEEIASPEGRPDADQVYEPLPPVADAELLYAVLIIADELGQVIVIAETQTLPLPQLRPEQHWVEEVQLPPAARQSTVRILEVFEALPQGFVAVTVSLIVSPKLKPVLVSLVPGFTLLITNP